MKKFTEEERLQLKKHFEEKEDEMRKALILELERYLEDWRVDIDRANGQRVILDLALDGTWTIHNTIENPSNSNTIRLFNEELSGYVDVFYDTFYDMRSDLEEYLSDEEYQKFKEWVYKTSESKEAALERLRLDSWHDYSTYNEDDYNEYLYGYVENYLENDIELKFPL